MKIALIYSFNPSEWVSCQKIVANLLMAYQAISPAIEIVHIHYDELIEPEELWENANVLIKENPTHLVFLDHRPHPLFFIRYFLTHGSPVTNPVFIFHTYGDFTLCLNSWAKLGELLRGKSALFYAASKRQKLMLGEFIQKDQIELCPFPVDSKQFIFKNSTRLDQRKKLDILNDEFVFLFTGRISRQKRVHQLMKTFVQWKNKNSANAKLIFVGEADGIGDPFAGKFEAEGEYFHFIYNLYKSLPVDDQACIEFKGFVPNEKINEFYCAADCLVNISVHNDEDYGMSCAEAMSAGLPLILTDWAGFSSFALPGLEQEVRFVPVKLGKTSKLISVSSLEAEMSYMYSKALKMKRSKISNEIQTYASVSSVSKIVKKGLNQASFFKGFKKFLDELGFIENNFNKNCFWNIKSGSFHSHYYRLYRHYVKNVAEHELK